MDIIRAAVDTQSGPPSIYDVTVTVRVRADRATDALSSVIELVAEAIDGT